MFRLGYVFVGLALLVGCAVDRDRQVDQKMNVMDRFAWDKPISGGEGYAPQDGSEDKGTTI